jgi:uncharacterized protein (TIGR00369 family)
MSNGTDPRSELRAAIDNLAEDRARTLLGWLRMDRRHQADEPAPDARPPGASDEQTLGPLGDMLGIVGEVREPGYARLRLIVDPAYFNPNGVLHGGVVYTLIDYSMGGAVQAGLPEGEHCATIEVKVSYLAAVRGGTLKAETHVVKQGRNIAFAESKVTDEQGQLVAAATGSMFIFRGDAGPETSAG